MFVWKNPRPFWSFQIKNLKTDVPDFCNRLLPDFLSSLTIKMTSVLASSHFVCAKPIIQHILLNSWAKQVSFSAINVPAIHRTTPKMLLASSFWEKKKHHSWSQSKEKINTILVVKIWKIGCWFFLDLFWEYYAYFSFSRAYWSNK